MIVQISATTLARLRCAYIPPSSPTSNGAWVWYLTRV